MGLEKKPKNRKTRRNAIGDALRRARQSQRMSQGALTAQLQRYGWDIGRTTWTKIELGERTVSDCELIAISHVLGISVDDITSTADPAVVRKILATLER